MEQYVNLSQVFWPGIVLVLIGFVLFTRKSVIAKIFGLFIALTGLYFGLLAVYVFNEVGAIAIVLIVMFLLGLKSAQTKGRYLVFGLIVCAIAGLGLFAMGSTYIPNFTAGQWFKDTIHFGTVVIGKIFGMADQGLGQLKR